MSGYFQKQLEANTEQAYLTGFENTIQGYFLVYIGKESLRSP